MTPDQPLLEAGTGLKLRPWRPSDAGDLVREIQDIEIVRWLDISLPYGPSDATGFIARSQDEWNRGSGAHFVIEQDGHFAGYLAALGLEGSLREIEVVYWVAADRRRSGVASAALSAIVTWLTSRGVDRIELGMAAGNTGSAAVVERVGFVLREVIQDAARVDGRSVDEWIYELPLSRSEDPVAPETR